MAPNAVAWAVVVGGGDGWQEFVVKHNPNTKGQY